MDANAKEIFAARVAEYVAAKGEAESLRVAAEALSAAAAEAHAALKAVSDAAGPGLVAYLANEAAIEAARDAYDAARAASDAANVEFWVARDWASELWESIYG